MSLYRGYFFANKQEADSTNRLQNPTFREEARGHLTSKLNSNGDEQVHATLNSFVNSTIKAQKRNKTTTTTTYYAIVLFISEASFDDDDHHHFGNRNHDLIYE